MQVKYKVFFDGEKRPSLQGVSRVNVMLDTYVVQAEHERIIQALTVGEQVSHTNRRRGVRVVMSNTALKVKRAASPDKYKPLEVTLDGIKTPTQIKVAAADALKSSSGWHRTVVIVHANMQQYKVKCNHKGLTYTECVHRCEIVSKKAA